MIVGLGVSCVNFGLAVVERKGDIPTTQPEQAHPEEQHHHEQRAASPEADQAHPEEQHVSELRT